MIALNTQSRLSRNAVIYRILRALFWTFVISLPMTIFGRSELFRAIFVLYALPSIIYTFLFRSTFYYVVTERMAMIHSGVIWRNTQNIPFDNVQNIQLSSGPLAGICGVKIVKVWTASPNQMGDRDYKPSGILILPKKEAEEFALALRKVS